MFDYLDLAVVFLSILSISVVKTIAEVPKPPIFNIYQRPTRTYWFKVVFMFIVLKLRQVGQYFKSERSRTEGINTYLLLDRPQQLSIDEQAVDAVFFNGANSKGDHFIIATARRKNRLVDGFAYLKIKESNIGLLQTPKLPSTELYQIEEKQEFEAEGISIKVVEPMKVWKISYDGKMKSAEDRTKTYDVKITAEWTSNKPCFNVDTDMDAYSMAKAMALEPWSRDYFQTLNDIHQTHYEQYGDMKATVTINGQNYSLNVNVLRDHSVGFKREWRNFHRYGLHFISVENGDRITAGVISTPVSFSCLPMGFVYSAKDKIVYPMKSCDLLLHQHGESGDPPLDYGFTIKAGNSTYVIKVHVTDSPHFYISKDWEAKIYERLCRFKVNNRNGWGAAEWQYRNAQGKDVDDYVDIKST